MKRLVDVAEKNAISWEEYNEYESICSKDDFSDEEEARFDELDAKVTRATVLCDNTNDFKYALEYFGVNDPIDTLAHENAHANKAEQLGVEFEGYFLKMIKAPDGHYIVDIGAYCNMDNKEEEWSVMKQKEASIQIIRAPDEYGNKMSQDDIDKLDKIEGLYKEE
jgi:hypothetical protein